MKTNSFVAALLFAVSTSFAQTAEKPWNVGAYMGKSEYRGDLGNGFFNYNKAYYGFAAANVSRYLNKSFDLSLYGSFGDHGFHKVYVDRFAAKSLNIDLTARYKFIQKEDAKLVPFVFAGIGMRNLTAKKGTRYNVNPGADLVIPVGAGVDYRLNASFSVRYFGTLGFTTNDTRDNLSDGGNDMQLQHNLGLTFSFGKKADADGDGISDKKDECPNTPTGALVDKKGCIIDGDKDGIADNLDACPQVAGISDFKGCPDTDKDGITDAEDSCPTVAGKSEFKGCPDSDNDGIEDAKDKCPTVAGISQFEGCPDTDGDGITDAQDLCPTRKGTAEMSGCPDTDGDGISDNIDKCPTTAGLKELKGCPEVKINAKAKEVFQKAMSGIQFESGKDVIKKTSYPILNNVVDVLKSNPDWNVEVQGHTDNVGNYDANKALSQNRALAVQNYLIQNGINAQNLKAKGFGSDQPIEDNKTPAGRAKNRRVEFKVTYEK